MQEKILNESYQYLNDLGQKATHSDKLVKYL